MHELIFTPQADADLREIENNPSQKNILKAVRRCLGFLETNLSVLLFSPCPSMRRFVNMSDVADYRFPSEPFFVMLPSALLFEPCPWLGAC